MIDAAVIHIAVDTGLPDTGFPKLLSLSPAARHAVPAALLIAVVLAAAAAAFAADAPQTPGEAPQVTVVPHPPVDAQPKHYVGNRPPLLPSPLLKLPIGAVKPEGWLRRQLELQADGFIGHLKELSDFLREDGNAWLSPTGEGHSGWEEVPYWLKGYCATAYVLGNEKMIAEARKWLDATIASQREDGYFGPRSNLTHAGDAKRRKPDLWPNMIMLNALQSYYEYSGDKRVLELMTRYFRWQLQLPAEDFLPPYWQQQRAGDNLLSVYWLYNRTGQPWLLELAQKIHRHTAPWEKGVANWHGVNICQCFREPATFYMQSKDHKHLQATINNYNTVMELYGQVPGGMFAADENCRPGYSDPRQCAETCSMVEMMLSHEILLRITGEVLWADRCEEVAFNSLPASMTADLKSLRYLTAPNHILSDRHNKAPGVQNHGPMMLFDPRSHRCCQHNVGHGWPYFTESLWHATPDGGLAATLYAPCQVTAKVAAGQEVTIVQTTTYPFDEHIQLKISLNKPCRFPLYLRIPGWCTDPQVTISGNRIPIPKNATGFLRLDHQWHEGDTILVTFPMEITVKTWEKNRRSVSVGRGPLWYSLRIEERYVRVGGDDRWPVWEIHPASPWNYGLAMEEDAKQAGQPDAAAGTTDVAKLFTVEKKPWPADDQPFAVPAAPIQLKTKARKIPAWQADALGLVGLLQDSPALSEEPLEEITLIPMGCARLRISSFPTVSTSPTANKWIAPPPRDKATASHCFHNDTVTALNDGLLPKNSADNSIPRFTWWDHRGTSEWVEYEFTQPRKVSQVEVYWFDDTGRGHCRVPKAWRVQWHDGRQWRDVLPTGPYQVEKDKWNTTTFEPVTTSRIRLVVELQPQFSAGILEWRVK